MDSKTRVLMALAHEKPDKVPFNFWMDRRLMSAYERDIGHPHWRVTHFGADVIETFAGLDFPRGSGEDHNGSYWHTSPFLKDWRDFETVPMPDPHQEAVYETIKKDLAEFPDKAIFLDLPTSWGVLTYVRTYELIYMDMVEYPEEFKKLSQKIADVQKVTVERACKMGITALYLMEDLAMTKGLTMSPEMINEFCLDYTTDLVEIAQSYNIPVLFHSDGMVMDLIEILAQAGVCAVNPLQPHLNDATEFKEKFGDRIAVYGGLDNCFIIPEGPPEKIRDHVQDTFTKLGKSDGGLIFSTHDIPLGTPKENVSAMIDAINECRYE